MNEYEKKIKALEEKVKILEETLETVKKCRCPSRCRVIFKRKQEH